MLQSDSSGSPESGLHLFRFSVYGPVREFLAVGEDGGVWQRKPDEKMYLRSISSSRAEVRQRENSTQLMPLQCLCGQSPPL